MAKIKLGEIAAEYARRARKEMTVTELCDWYLTEAPAGRILGRRNRPIKASSLAMDESRIKTHIKPLLGKRIARHLTIADVEEMQDDVKNHKTQKVAAADAAAKKPAGKAGSSKMVLTRDFKETMKERAARDSAFARACWMRQRTHFSMANHISQD